MCETQRGYRRPVSRIAPKRRCNNKWKVERPTVLSCLRAEPFVRNVPCQRPLQGQDSARPDLSNEGKGGAVYIASCCYLRGPFSLNPGAIVQRKADEKCILGLTKTGNGDRFITLGAQLVALLKRWLLVLPRSSALPAPSRPNKTAHLLLPTSLGTAQTHANVTNRMWVPLRQAAGLARRAKSRKGEAILRPSYRSTLRHIYASLLIERVITPKQFRCGWGTALSRFTYDLYGHLFDQRDADRKIGAALERDLLR